LTFSRRDFVKTSVLGAFAAGVGPNAANAFAAAEERGHASSADSPKRPVIICANNGHAYVEAAYAFLKGGGDTLDAAIRVVKGPEDDPNDDSVGLGGLPNEEGVVELDACCMHGPTRRAGSVGGVRNIKNVALVSKAVMEHTGHVMLVGEGAERFAVAMGFPRENLLTERSRKIWLLWKEFNSDRDWWGPGMADPHWQPPNLDSKPQSELWRDRIEQLKQRAGDIGIEPEFQLAAVHRVLFPPTGTIHCSALNEKGEISGVTTTSGLAFKLPGRCGD
jgi:N4-(beta-N-acetylglucosaminyl)-L-asparaginase